MISTEGKIAGADRRGGKEGQGPGGAGAQGREVQRPGAANSDDTETARSGGELPGYKRGQLMKPIDDIVFKQNKGFVTDPIRVPNGFVILRIMERYEKGLATFEEVENEINEKMVMPQMNAKVRTYLTKLRTEAFLEIKTGYVDSGAAPGKDTAWRDVAQLKPQTVTKEEVASHKKRKKLLWLIPIPGTGGVKKPAPSSTQPAAAPAAAAPASASAPASSAPSQP